MKKIRVANVVVVALVIAAAAVASGPSLDPTAQVGIGGVVLPSSIRRRYLEKVLEAYENRYGRPMPRQILSCMMLRMHAASGAGTSTLGPMNLFLISSAV